MSSGEAMTPDPFTLRIVDGREGSTEAPVVRSRAFQLKTEEARVPPDVFVGMYHIHLLYVLFIYV